MKITKESFYLLFLVFHAMQQLANEFMKQFDHKESKMAPKI